MVIVWDYKKTRFNRRDPRYRVWRLERLFTHGLNEKVSKRELKKYWNKIKIDPERRAALKVLLWPKKR